MGDLGRGSSAYAVLALAAPGTLAPDWSLGRRAGWVASSAAVDENNVATATDVARLLQTAADNDLIRSITTTRGYEFRSPRRRLHRIPNTNRLLYGRYQVLGGKTGFINESGYCLATWVRTDGRDMIAVVLGAPTNATRFADVVRLVRAHPQGRHSRRVAGLRAPRRSIERARRVSRGAGAMSGRERLVAALTGSVAGLASGLFGVGGGIVLVPLLTGPLRLGQHQAHGTSLAVIGLTAIVSISVYALHGNVGGVGDRGACPGSGELLRRPVRRAPRRPRFIALARALVRDFPRGGRALILLFQPDSVAGAAPIPPGPARWIFDVILGGMAGVLAGYMGVGGGMLIVPALTIFTGMTQQLAQATSLTVILLAAPGGALEHRRKGNIVFRLVPWLALGAAIGAPLAALAAQSLPQKTLTRWFALFLLANAILGWLRSGARARQVPEVPSGVTSDEASKSR